MTRRPTERENVSEAGHVEQLLWEFFWLSVSTVESKARGGEGAYNLEGEAAARDFLLVGREEGSGILVSCDEGNSCWWPSGI